VGSGAPSPCSDSDWRESDSAWKDEGVCVSFLVLTGRRGKPQPGRELGDQTGWCLQQIKAKMNYSKK